MKTLKVSIIATLGLVYLGCVLGYYVGKVFDMHTRMTHGETYLNVTIRHPNILLSFMRIT